MATWLEDQALPEHEYKIPEDFANNAAVTNREQYDAMYRQSLDDPEAFWGGIAKELHWNKSWQTPFMKYKPHPPCSMSFTAAVAIYLWDFRRRGLPTPGGGGGGGDRKTDRQTDRQTFMAP